MGSNIGAGDFLEIPPDFKYLEDEKASAANAFKALNALITDCEDNLSNPMACQVADALTTGGYDIADNIFAADDGTVYMDNQASQVLSSSIPNFEFENGELKYKNGECIVPIEDLLDITPGPIFNIDNGDILGLSTIGMSGVPILISNDELNGISFVDGRYSAIELF